jgi:hypothetical protein
MKFLITESKRDQLIDKYISDYLGGLTKLKNDKNGLFFFIKDTGEKPTKDDIVFYYSKDTQAAYIPWTLITSLNIFGCGLFEARRLIQDWLLKTYNIRVYDLYRNI